ncbi:MAG TPA: metalloregulator ArsR/SmtB family transcription factor [Bacillota bacterium]|nr:metalloregulator ArsR/SmtB family transcription factor [Bacillota bacterium]HRS20243.1 metalloregulator ArsR/SmtB family transcription factor [Clostridia bacterium]HRU40654.1 metalloregulator ArsR/SmtB family transcription factor [Candidatus Diapherotrites archaeon]HOS70237.1 metalloregulator ArsR/SmtB family transcription factor [Bacillota bacterium]HQJ36749.1 metalloregulator ArsR/SmtB family transcription factor [Bacillota bacterium]
MNISKICNALGNEVRYQIVKSLKNRSIGTCCNRIEYYENGISVGDVVNATGLAQSTVSQHIKVLLDAGIIYKEKRGQWTCFFLNEEIINKFIKELSDDLIQTECDCKK